MEGYIFLPKVLIFDSVICRFVWNCFRISTTSAN